MNNNTPTCQVCGQGELKKKKKYRMSGPVILIGYIILIPSILGMLSGVFLVFATGDAASDTAESLKIDARQQLATADIPAEVIEKVISREPLSETDHNLLSDEQSRAISDVRRSYSAGQLGTGAGAVIFGGFGLFVIIASFVGGLLGWLLVMKKGVLQCNRCKVVVATS